jgi:hypothetical protein
LNKNVSRLVLRVTSICLQLDRLNGFRWHIPNGVAMVIGFYIIRLKRKNGNRKLFKRVALSSNLINV